jgi:hypothetical protein
MPITFSTTLLQAEDVNAAGIRVPDDVLAALNKGKGPKVLVTVNGHTWHGTVQTSNGRPMLAVSQALRQEIGIKGGDRIDVTIELDTEPRTVDVPDDLKAALSGKEGALAEFEALAYSKRKEFVRQVEEAKAQETRGRRIANIVAQMGES